MDLLQDMTQNKEETDAIILERVKEGPNKVQFHVEVGMIKIPTVQDGATGNFEGAMLIPNIRALTVYFEVIAGDQYLELIEHMVKQVNSFSSHGRGWTIDRIEKLQNTFAAFSPIKAGYYLKKQSLILRSGPRRNSEKPVGNTKCQWGGLRDMDRFETLNNCQINVFW